jgi:hypothetical protein
MKLLVASLLLLCLDSQTGHAQTVGNGHHVYMRGSELLNECSNVYGNSGHQNATKATHCLGFMAGFIDGATYGSSLDACIPQEADLGQLVRVIVKYLANHPEDLHLSAASLIDKATLEAFPCKK